MNLQEDYCSSEIVKLLREKGFKCGATYSKGFVKDGNGFVGGLVRHEDKITHQMAMKWLRQKGIFVEITAISLEIITFEFEIKVIDKEHGFAFYPESGCNEKPTYEEAVDAAIHWTLENLL